MEVVWARKAGWVSRLSTAAVKGPTAGWSSASAAAFGGGSDSWPAPDPVICPDLPADGRQSGLLTGRNLGEVERHLGVGDLGAVELEDPERVAVLALVEDLRGRRDDELRRAVGEFEHLAQGLAVGRWEIARRRRRAIP